jgi:hypothetical protein
MSVSIPLRRLARHCNPFYGDPWGVALHKRDVRAALKERRLVAVPNTDDHAGRVAYFVVYEADKPIEIDVGVPVVGYYVDWMVTDGNHRLAAAIYAGRPSIAASVGGQLDYAKKLFGVECEEPKR